MKTSAHRAVLATSLALALLTSGAWSLASTANAAVPLPSKTVRYDDLNLDQARDVVILYGRLQAAAREVCGADTQPGRKFVSADWKACVATAVDQGVRKVDRPALTAYHAAKTAAPTLIRVASRD